MDGIRERLRQGGLVLSCMAASLAAVAGGCGSSEEGDGGSAPATVATNASPTSRSGPVSAGHTAKLNPTEVLSARAMGRRACEGKTAIEVARHFDGAARDAGAERYFVAAVARPNRATESSPGYPRLVASLYATTVPERVRAAAAAGCAQELAASIRGAENPSNRAGQPKLPETGSESQKGSR